MTATLDAHLPDGYDDPADPFHVPPMLREHYWADEYASRADQTDDTISELNLRIAANWLAAFSFTQATGRPPAAGSTEDRAAIDWLSARFLAAADEDALILYFQHRIALMDAYVRLRQSLEPER